VKVSVATTTYNQGRYIAEAVNSVLMQECDFDFEYIIADDASTDDTPRILKELQSQYPGKIRLVLRDENIGAQRNLGDILLRCTGEYVALLDGDDYWTSPHKLQKQVDFMEAHPGCALSFHDVSCIDAGGQCLQVDPVVVESERLSVEDILKGNFISACAVMYRWGLVPSLPEWWYERWIGDWPLHVLHAQFGWIGHIPEVMAAYRVHGGGLWSGQRARERAEEFMVTLRLLDATMDYRYHSAVEEVEFLAKVSAFGERWEVAAGELGHRNRAAERRDAWWLVTHLEHRGDIPIYQVIVPVVQGFLPWLVPPIVALKALVRGWLRGGRS